jgi:hypothetical protein
MERDRSPKKRSLGRILLDLLPDRASVRAFDNTPTDRSPQAYGDSDSGPDPRLVTAVGQKIDAHFDRLGIQDPGSTGLPQEVAVSQQADMAPQQPDAPQITA